MTTRRPFPSRTLAVVLGTTSAVLGCATPARADIGVPMLMVMAVPMWVSLLVIIPLEAWVARKLVGSGWAASLRLSAITNLVSTVVGVPLTWIVLMLAQLPLQGVAAHLYAARIPPGAGAAFATAATKAFGVILGGAWLYPFESELFWLIPAAALVLCVPFFYASVWIEYFVGRRLVPREQSPVLRAWAWKANLASYCLLALVPAVLLATSLVRHARTAGDEEHRSVDLVSADRLWQRALARERKRQEEVRREREIPTATGDARPRALNRADSLWRAGDDAHRADDDGRAERDWVTSLAEYDRLEALPGRARVASAISPSEVAHSLAYLYYAQARYAEAKPLFERLVRVRDATIARGGEHAFPGYPLELGDAYEKTGDTLRAEQYYQHLVEQEGSLPRGDSGVVLGALVRLADRRMARGDSSRAEDLYRRAVAAGQYAFDPSDVDRALCRLARIYRARHRFADAETLLASGIAGGADRYAAQEFPDSAGAAPFFLDLAMVYLDEGALPQAEHAVRTALRWDTRLGEEAEVYAQVLERQGRLAEAKSWRQRARSVTAGAKPR